MNCQAAVRRRVGLGRARVAIQRLEPRAYLSEIAFSPPIVTSAASAGITPVNVELEYIYGDGWVDLITANSNKSVSILRGQGDGTFGAATTVPLNFSPMAIAAGNLSRTGLAGIVLGSATASSFGVILQPSSGQFSEQNFATALANTNSIAIGDFNGDGTTDLAIASDDGGTSNNVAIFLNNGAGAFTLSQTLSVPHADLASITTFTGGNGINLAVADSADNAVTTLLNNGSGHFALGSDYSVGSDPVSIVDGDFGPNDDDLVTANATGGSISILLGNGDGTFHASMQTAVDGSASGGGPVRLGVAYLYPNFFPHLVCLLSPGSYADADALISNGDGTFRDGGTISVDGGTQTAIAAGDFNSDGVSDVVLADSNAVTALFDLINENGRGPSADLGTNQPVTDTGAAAIDFNVTYTDGVQVQIRSLGDGNLTVTTPAGATVPATLVSTDLFPSYDVTVTYSIPAQSGSAGLDDNGIYTVTANGNSVRNVGGIALAGGEIGQFGVLVGTSTTAPYTPATPPIPIGMGPDLVATDVTVINPATAVAGTRFGGVTRVTVANEGNESAVGTIAIDLYASASDVVPTGTPVLTSVTRKLDLKVGRKVVEMLPGFTWPAGIVGVFYVVAEVNATRTMLQTTYAYDFGISDNPTAVALPFVDIDNLWPGKLPAVLKRGRRTALAVPLKNVGNTAAHATATLTVEAVDASGNATVVGSRSIRLAAAPNGRETVRVPLTLPQALAPGTYSLSVIINCPDDANSGNDTATSGDEFTV